MASKIGKISDSEAKHKWAMERPFCMICGWSPLKCQVAHLPYKGDEILWLETDHISGGAGRSDESANLCRICSRCHRLKHGARIKRDDGTYWPKLTLANILWAKKRSNPAEYDAFRIGVLLGRPAPEPEEPAEVFMVEWRRNKRG